MRIPTNKICLITPPDLGDPEQFYLKIEEALSNGIRCVQFRNKRLSKRDALRVSIRLRGLCHQYQSLFIVNDDIDLALASDSGGIHIGQADFPLDLTRKLVGSGKIVGVSTHSLRQALEAERGGADYIGFGSIFPTESKETGERVGLEDLKKISEGVSIPIFAIGGISTANVSWVLESGASGVAVISSIWNARSIGEAVRKLIEEVHRKNP